MSEEKNEEKQYSFVQKVWIVGLIFSLIVTVLLIFEATFDLLVLVLAGALIACYFRGLSDLIHKKTQWNQKITLSIATVGTFLIVLGAIYFIGDTIGSQTVQMKKEFPVMIDNLESHLENSSIGREVLEKGKEIKSSENFEKFASRFLMTTFSGIANIYVVLIIGIFFTISPGVYVKGVLELVPPKNRKAANDVMEHLGSGLKKWLFGKFIAMLAVFILTAIGLVILDIPMWLTLAILAGLLNFIPNFGPLAAMVPAVLVAFTVSPTIALIVAGLYVVIQLIESSFITPQAQKKLIDIPPALIISAQVFVGALTGIWGVMFATPLVLIIIILVQDLYIKPMEQRAENG